MAIDKSIDLTDVLEFLVLADDDNGISLGGFSAIYRRINLVSRLVVSGEVIFDNRPSTFKDFIRVNIAIYDSEGRVASRKDQLVGEIGCNYDAFSIHFEPEEHCSASRIRVWTSS
jgi:hypothetical protein